MKQFLFLFLGIICSMNASGYNKPSREDATHITPGGIWADDKGEHINAHGGCMLYKDGVYYWYGEKRPARGFTTDAGVSVYSSTDLINWKSLGEALSVTHTAGHDIESGCIIERPKVVYNEKTGKYVMLFHLELKGMGYAAARVGFAQSASPTGPFEFVRSLRPNAGIWPKDFSRKDKKAALQLKEENHKDWWTPAWRKDIEKGMLLKRDIATGQMSRDMTVFIDDNGKAYHIYSSEENLTIHIAELTLDYMSYTGRYIRVAPGGQNEAPTILKHNGTYWLITSGCTGWAPNAARMFSASSIWGPWKSHPSPFKGEHAEKTFFSQGTFIFKEQASQQYIFMADRWNPASLAASEHIWLPIDFSSTGTPVIRWEEKWKP